MKIAFLADSFLPHSGGSRVYYYNLYKSRLAGSEDRVTVLTKKVPGWREFDRRESNDAMRIVRRFKPLPSWKYYQLPKVIFPLAHAFWLVHREATDLIHCGDLYPPGVISLWFKRLLGIPYLVYCHGDEIAQTDRRRYQPMVRDLIYRGADAVVAANEFARQNLLRIGIAPDRIHKITPGVDCERFRPRPRDPELAARFCPNGETVLLTAARLVPRKGHRNVLLALAKIVREVPKLRYLIVGEGPEKERLQSLAAKLGLGQVVAFVGDVPNERLGDFYNLCDLFVMANRESESGDIESFGMVFVEANAAGKAVVGGRSGGAVEAVVDGVTGLLANPDDVDELAAALKKLLADEPLRRKLGDAGLRRARAEFDWKTRAELLRQIDQEILQKARARGGRQS